MDSTDPKQERLTEFERAVCYETLPHVLTPLTLRIILLYTLALAAAFLLMAYGLREDHPVWKPWGNRIFAVVVGLGLVGFIYRALRNAVRVRSALAQAGGMPNVESGFDDLPDPFAGHALLRYHRTGRAVEKMITGNKGETVYIAKRILGEHGWEVQDPAGELVFRIEASRPPRSFSFDWGVPSQFRVMRGDVQTGVIDRRFSLGPGRVEITGERQPGKPLVFRAGELNDGNALVGRIYDLRNYLYLDVRQSYLDDALLAFYICVLD